MIDIKKELNRPLLDFVREYSVGVKLDQNDMKGFYATLTVKGEGIEQIFCGERRDNTEDATKDAIAMYKEFPSTEATGYRFPMQQFERR